jgi:hypothetical protein
MIYCCIITRKNVAAAVRRHEANFRDRRINHANQNYPGDMKLQFRENLERIEQSVHQIFDLFQERKIL